MSRVLFRANPSGPLHAASHAQHTPLAQEAPTLTREALRQALPGNSFELERLRAFGFLGLDLALLALVYALSAELESPWLLPVFAFAEGTLFWALFVLGHECGHRSFTGRRALDDFVGHLLHTPLLVPYHAWRISHRQHHRWVGHADRDLVWVPLSRAQKEALSPIVRFLRFRAFLVAFPFYLLRGTPGRAYGSHYDLGSGLFAPAETKRVARSIAGCALWALVLGALSAWLGIAFVVKHWALPWGVFCVWAALVTYLHHTHPAVRWRRGERWTPLAGALATVDRTYGAFERVHHDAGAHTVHHLFPRIPHYRLRAARAALRPVLGEALLEADEPVFRSIITAARCCQTVAPMGYEMGYGMGYEMGYGKGYGMGDVLCYEALDPMCPEPASGAASSPATR